MNLPKSLPSREFLQECFTYDEEQGTLIWKERPRSHFVRDGTWKQFNNRSPGRTAYIQVYRDKAKTAPRNCMVKLRWNGVSHMFCAHRIIFCLMGVEIPDGMLPDHENRNPFDNRWINLRIGTHAQNSANKKAGKKTKNPNLPKGVSTYGREGEPIKYRISCEHNGKRIQKYRFKTADEAHQAYLKLSRQMHGCFHSPG